MIDFRYHIVSLISVFLALAVGIVLGAGPLRDYIADSLTGQVDQLRAEKDTLRSNLDEAQQERENSEAFLSEATDPLVSGVLPDFSVALLTLPGADADSTEDVSDALESAGASVDAQLEVTTTFTSKSDRSFRSGIAGSISAYMSPEPPDDASVESTLGAALGQALTDYDPQDPAESSDDADSMYELLLSSDLIDEVTEFSAPVDAIALVAPEDPGSEETNAAGLALAGSLAQVPGGLTVLGHDNSDEDLVHVIRADSDAADHVTTVDSPDQAMGLIIAVRALAQDFAGTSGSYGFAEDVNGILPADADLQAPALPDAEEADDADDADDGAA